jgi:anti-sigma B factor antagonist
MKVSATYEDGLAVIAAGGELDAATSPLLREAVDHALELGAQWMLIDLQGLDFIGSVGIGELIRAAKSLGERSGELAIACRRPNVTRVFDISGTGEMLHVRAEESEARAVLAEARQRFAAACSPDTGETPVPPGNGTAAGAPQEEGEEHGQAD